MFFSSNATLGQIHKWFDSQVTAVYNVSKNGIDIEVRSHRNKRTNQQNRFLYAILVALLRFYEKTGFRPAGVSDWGMRVDVLKIYYKARFGVSKTSKLNTKDFGEFIDRIQQSLVQETNGEWEILEPDSAYVRALLESGGY